MKTIILCGISLITMAITAQEVSIPTTESCNNTEFTAVAKVYTTNTTAIGIWSIPTNQTGAFFKENGQTTLNVVVPTGGVYLPVTVNSGSNAGTITVSFRLVNTASASTNVVACEVVEPTPTVISVNRGKAKGKNK